MSHIEEAVMSNTIEALRRAARNRTQVQIEYRYLDHASRTYRMVEPIKWEFGRKGLHIMTYSVDDEHWRRFAVKNIVKIITTDTPYESNLPVTANELPPMETQDMETQDMETQEPKKDSNLHPVFNHLIENIFPTLS